MKQLSQNNFNLLINKLDEFIRKYYKNQLLKGCIYSITALLAAFLIVNVLEYFGQFDINIRTLLFYTFVLVSFYSLIRYIIIPLIHLSKLGKVIDHETAAKIIGHHFQSVKDKLLNTLELKQQFEISKKNTELIEASINQRIEDLKPIPFVAAINFSENKKYLKYAIIPVIIILVISFSSPKIISESTGRLIEHRTYFEKQAPFRFVVQNKTLKAIAHEDFLLELKIEGELTPENVYIQYHGLNFKLDKHNKVSFSFLFKNIQNDIDFHFKAEGFNSKHYKLTAIPKPLILDFDIKMDYPLYIKKKNEIQHNSGDLLIPVGTKVFWNFNSQNTSTIKMNFNDSSVFIDRTGDNSFKYFKQVFNDNIYTITPSNDLLKDYDSIRYSISTIPDLYPSIQVEQQFDSINNKVYYFFGEIKDDYGLTKLTFNHRFLETGKTETFNKELFVTPIVINKNFTADQFYHLWDLHTLNISSGDLIEYYFEVWDNDGVFGNKSTKSNKMIFKAPTIEEILKLTEQNNESIKDKISESIEQSKDIQKGINEIKEKLLNKKNMTWEDKKMIEDLLKKQQSLEQNVKDIQLKNKQNNSQKSEYKKDISESLLEKQQKLQELFEEVLNDETKKLFEELQKLMEEFSNNTKFLEKLEDMELTDKDIEKEMDRLLELFKQIEFEQKLQEAISSLQKLAEDENKLSEESLKKEIDKEALQKEQEKLNDKFQNLKEDFKELERKNQSLSQPDYPIEKTQQEQESIQQELNKSSEQLDNNNRKKASQHQKSASDQMQQLAQNLESMMQNMQKESLNDDLDAIRIILENLITLSFDQEKLMDKLNSTSIENPKYIEVAQQQHKLKEDAKMLEDSLLALSKRVIEIKSFINSEINLINNNIEKSIEALEERKTANASIRQQYVMTSINNIAVMLSEVMQKMQEQLANQMPGMQQCQKPNSKGKRTPKLSEMQKELNEQLEQLKENMKKGKQQEGTKANSKNSLSPELAKLAAKQSAIRKELKRLEELNNQKGQKKSNNLDELSDMMDQTETDLVNKLLSQETLMRQKEILTRLLEAEKSLREQEISEERESQEGKNENLRNFFSLEQYKRLKTNEIEFLKTMPPTLIPYYKNKVEQYYQIIEK